MYHTNLRLPRGRMLIAGVAGFGVVSLLALGPVRQAAFDTAGALLQNASLRDQRSSDAGTSMPQLTPWACVGGCGAGGSGGGGGDGIKWLGFGQTGGLIDVEMLPRYSFGQNFQTFSFSPRFSFKPTYTTTMGVSVPITSKKGEVQPQTNYEPFDRTTGGFGDLSVDISKPFGASGEYSLSLAFALPTGQYDIKRGSDRGTTIFLPSSLQKGGGIYSASVSVSRTIDVEDGMWLVDASYSNPFNFKISGENEFVNNDDPTKNYFAAYANDKDNTRFYYTFKPYGESDLGAFSPPSVTGSVNYCYKGVEHYVFGGGVMFSAPLGVAWIPSPKINTYDPKPDSDHKAWSAALFYGIEFVRPQFPMYVAISMPFHDKKNTASSDPYDPTPFAKWDGVDWSDFGQQWTFALGIKTTLF